jgi:hypothetical protein
MGRDPEELDYTELRGDFGGQYESVEIGRSGPVPMAQPLPPLDDILALDVGDRIALLQRFGVEAAWSQYISDQAAYLARVSKIPPGSQAWQDEMARLSDIFSSRGSLQMSRRATEQYTTVSAMHDNPAEEFIRISEGDDRVCSECERLEGEVGTYDYHASLGLPGAASCLGGDQCRCTLLPYGPSEYE